ncbi:MAG: YigZ family protein [Ignavibacteriaceae bacterium]|nr:YigZ family protein [Ignavibacteriaceae bacterium]
MTDNLPLKYKTISAFSESKYKEKGSLFIGRAYPVADAAEAESILASVRKEFYDATHNCWAWKLKDGSFRYSDDGEPNGTAGIRILSAMNHFELSDMIAISTRYYGGTKLGVGPLGKAYYESAYTALQENKIIELTRFAEVLFTVGFDDTGKIFHHLQKNFIRLTSQDYADQLTVTAEIRYDLSEKFCSDIFQEFHGRINISAGDKVIYRQD